MVYKMNTLARRRRDENDIEASEQLLASEQISSGPSPLKSSKAKKQLPWWKRTVMFGAPITAVLCLLAVYGSMAQASPREQRSCDQVEIGYQCDPRISHFWGQYSPFYSVPSEIKDRLPAGCSVDQASILSRHGARDPTSSKTKTYKALIQKIQNSVQAFSGRYAFLKDYKYALGADQLTAFGQQEMINSGFRFYARYRGLAQDSVPFVRASGEQRVIDSAYNWTQGFNQGNLKDKHAKHAAYPYPVLVIPEGSAYNNTLNHGLCTAFEDGPASNTADDAEGQWQTVFTPPIQQRLNKDLPGANLTQTDIVNLMSICPFETVASATGQISDFCRLFTEDEWHQYDYFQSLDKYYGYGAGNALGPTQGVGFVNELIARLTNSAVRDETTTNHTLDANRETFPLDRALYADFSHDNDMTGVFFALGLYDETAPLSNSTVNSVKQTKGYSASWSVPFGGRAYFERVRCERGLKHSDEYVRVLVNDRVVPLQNCKANKHGLCLLKDFVQSQAFAQGGGEWDQCFV